MTLSRRSFVKSLGGAAAFIGARGHEAWASTDSEAPFIAEETDDLILSSNENPLGPGAHVLDAIRDVIGPDGAGAGRYMFGHINDTAEFIGKQNGVERENVMIGLGSSQILRVSAQVFTSKQHGVISPDPTFATCPRYAELIGHPARWIPLDASMYVDLDAMLEKSKGTGLVYTCNPNNPTATVHNARDMKAFVDEITKRSDAMVLVDEAYHDYVTDPEHESLLALAAEHPRLIVARTFSKAYGLAGLRLGYAVAHPDTIKKMVEWRGLDVFTSLPGRIAAIAAIDNQDHLQQEVARNAKVRDFTRKWFHDAGYEDTESQTNFVYVDIRQSAAEFQTATLERGVRIGGVSKLYPNYARVTIGTMDEMERAIKVFSELLPVKNKAVA